MREEKRAIRRYLIVYLCCLSFLIYMIKLDYITDLVVISIVFTIHLILLLSSYFNFYSSTYRFIHRLLVFAIFIQLFLVSLECLLVFLIYLVALTLIWSRFQGRCPLKSWYDKRYPKISVYTWNQWSMLILISCIKLVFIVILRYDST